MNVAHLRAAATHLRSPLLSNWSTDVAHALASALESAAHRASYPPGSIPLFALDRHLADVAVAALRSLGHTCIDGETCGACARLDDSPEHNPGDVEVVESRSAG